MKKVARVRLFFLYKGIQDLCQKGNPLIMSTKWDFLLSDNEQCVRFCTSDYCMSGQKNVSLQA